MGTNRDAGSAMNRRDPSPSPVDPAPIPVPNSAHPSASPSDEMVALTHGQKWADFYEAFDQLVHEHFNRSNELLREAMVLPTVADQEVAAIRRQAAERVAAERHRHGALLQTVRAEIAQMAAQLTEMQQRTSRLAAQLIELAARVTTAIDTISQDVTDAASVTSDETEGDPPRVVESPTAAAISPDADDKGPSEAANPGPVSQHLIVHGVRQARLALSLQRHLYGLPHVDGVETREYQDGTVQLQVRAARPLTEDDLHTWSEGGSLVIEQMTVELIEARLSEGAGSHGRTRAGRWWGSREAASQSKDGIQ